MYYGFDSLEGNAVFSISVMPEAQEGITVIESSEDYNLEDIYLAGGEIAVRHREPKAVDHHNEIQRRIAMATTEINILTDKIDLDMADKGDEALLVEWKRYRIALHKLDAASADLEWPIAPQS